MAHIRTQAAGAGFSKGLVGDETGLEAGSEVTWKLASGAVSGPAYKKMKRRQDSAHYEKHSSGSHVRGGIGGPCMGLPEYAGDRSRRRHPNPCDALKRIVAAAPDGFTSLRPDDGKAVAQPYGRDAQCVAKAGTYSCTWTKGANAGSAADALQGVAADIAACLPDATHDQNSPGRQHFYIGARGQRTQITATTAGAGKLTLAVSGK